MNWRKHGVIWAPDGSQPWALKYATCPTPIRLEDGRLRVFLQSRDSSNVGRVGYIDCDARDPRRVVGVAPRPVLDIGCPGAFDDNGVFQTSVVRAPDGRLFMYYVGFEICHRIRYRLLTGLAISEDGGESFVREKTTPILERSPSEMCIRGGPFVMNEGGRYRMWYVGGGDWEVVEGKAMPVYDVRYLESTDGIAWPGDGRVVIPIEPTTEHGLGRPFVLRDERGYRMHYSVRKRRPAAYRVGYATSPDGITWTRKDQDLGLDVSDTGWDSESVEYTAEIEADGKTWLMYNGNDFGSTGLGIAELLDR